MLQRLCLVLMLGMFNSIALAKTCVLHSGTMTRGRDATLIKSWIACNGAQKRELANTSGDIYSELANQLHNVKQQEAVELRNCTTTKTFAESVSVLEHTCVLEGR